jgi:hypothetical protein
MPGRISVDRDWLQVEPMRLDPSAARQELVVRLLPRQQPWGHASATVTVATDHGERRVLVVHAHRRSWLPAMLGAALLGLGGVAALAIFLLLPRAGGTAADKPGVDLVIDPVADRVLVDGQMVGYGSTVFIPQGALTNFSLRVEADGFEPHEELVTLAKGEHTSRSISLSLVDPMTWAPPDTEPAPPPASVRSDLEALAPRLLPCFEGIAGDVSANYSAWITGDGQVRKLEIADAAYPVEATKPCLSRAFRGLRTGRFEGGHTVVTVRLDPRAHP